MRCPPNACPKFMCPNPMLPQGKKHGVGILRSAFRKGEARAATDPPSGAVAGGVSGDGAPPRASGTAPTRAKGGWVSSGEGPAEPAAKGRASGE